MNQNNISQVNQILKAAAKSQGLTQNMLAKRLRVSEPTVKRWMRGEGISIQQWLTLIEVLGVGFSDLAAALNESEAHQFEYTDKQESALAETEGLLAFFQLLLLGSTPAEIMKLHSLSKVAVSFYLKQLAAISLIEWTEGISCKIKVRGEPKWRKNGALSKKFRDRLFSEFIYSRKNSDCFRMGIYELPKKDFQLLSDAVEKVFQAASQSEKKAKLLKLKTETVCVGTCLDMYSPEFLSKIPDRAVKKN